MEHTGVGVGVFVFMNVLVRVHIALPCPSERCCTATGCVLLWWGMYVEGQPGTTLSGELPPVTVVCMLALGPQVGRVVVIACGGVLLCTRSSQKPL